MRKDLEMIVWHMFNMSVVLRECTDEESDNVVMFCGQKLWKALICWRMTMVQDLSAIRMKPWISRYEGCLQPVGCWTARSLKAGEGVQKAERVCTGWSFNEADALHWDYRTEKCGCILTTTDCSFIWDWCASLKQMATVFLHWQI